MPVWTSSDGAHRVAVEDLRPESRLRAAFELNRVGGPDDKYDPDDVCAFLGCHPYLSLVLAGPTAVEAVYRGEVLAYIENFADALLSPSGLTAWHGMQSDEWQRPAESAADAARRAIVEDILGARRWRAEMTQMAERWITILSRDGVDAAIDFYYGLRIEYLEVPTRQVPHPAGGD